VTTLKAIRRRTKKNLQILEERQAKQGNEADIKLLNEIEDHQKALILLDEAMTGEQTEVTLAALKEALRPLLVATNVETIDLESLEFEIPPQPYEPEMVTIPAGPFLLGNPPGQGSPAEESPQHQVSLPAYAIGKYPVTAEQYQEFIKQNRQQAVPEKGWSKINRTPLASLLGHPVVSVSWDDAVAYCIWLSQNTRRTYRLPSEAEWEKAAAWDEATGQKRVYPWGDTWDPARCNTGSDKTSPVTAFPDGASPYGGLDMAGNVQEWTSTVWGVDLSVPDFTYPYRANDGRETMTRLYRAFRIHRGGSFRSPITSLRCAARGRSDPDAASSGRGFRVVLEL
jgi:formylglycine-generating enzyme required for sulfatase activity